LIAIQCGRSASTGSSQSVCPSIGQNCGNYAAVRATKRREEMNNIHQKYVELLQKLDAILDDDNTINIYPMVEEMTEMGIRLYADIQRQLNNMQNDYLQGVIRYDEWVAGAFEIFAQEWENLKGDRVTLPKGTTHPGLNQREKNLVWEKKLIGAIKEYRTRTGEALRDAKWVVDKYKHDQRQCMCFSLGPRCSHGLELLIQK